MRDRLLAALDRVAGEEGVDRREIEMWRGLVESLRPKDDGTK